MSNAEPRPARLTAEELPAALSARFYVNQLNKSQYGDGVVMQVGYANGHNAQWAAATPTGKIEMGLAKGNPASQFFEAAMEAGDDIAIEFRRVPRESA